jgi:hypothetical protein
MPLRDYLMASAELTERAAVTIRPRTMDSAVDAVVQALTAGQSLPGTFAVAAGDTLVATLAVATIDFTKFEFFGVQ